MDLDIIQSTKEGEITQFLCDVRDYFRASLATSEYENTSNMFFMTESDSTEQLLQRCEQLLNRLSNNKCQNQNQQNLITYTIPKPVAATTTAAVTNGLQNHQWQSSKDSFKQHHQHHQHQQQQHSDPHQHSTPINYSSAIINGCSTTTTTTSQPDHQQSSSATHLYHQHQPEDVSYLDMSAANNKKKSSHSPREQVDLNSSADSDKTFRCSTMIVKQNKSFLHRLHDTMTTTTDEEAENDSLDGQLDDDFEDDPQIYDICQVTTQGSDGEEDHLGHEETQKAITPDSHFSLPHLDCPYMDLPAGHLAIHKSAKYGQLQRIEKRLFFDQSKKCYCGILNDWLLCYADGPTSNKPTISLYLKMPGIEIEHFGEGKRRDVCFQVSTPDPNKRFVFQAVNEIDAKEWIHAVEAAIRSDIGGVSGSLGKSAAITRNSSGRKLPTPPVMKKMTFLSTFQKSADMKNHSNAMTSSITSSDCIYEEPSPVYNVQKQAIIAAAAAGPGAVNPPDLPQKQNSPSALAERFEYDVPKCPPQPLNGQTEDIQLINPYDNDKESMAASPQKTTSPVPPVVNLNFTTPPKISLKMEEKLNFQAKVKDVHSKLSSQLSNGPVLKKPLKKTYSSGSTQNDGESLIMSTSPVSSPPPSSSSSSAEMKKQKKSTTPQNSPQKSAEKTSSTKNWFLNRLNKTTSSTRSNSSSTSNTNAPAKCKQSEKENLLNAADTVDSYDVNDSNVSSNPASPILKSATTSSSGSTPIANGKGKVNMLINQLEASGHLASMFTVDAVASFSSFCDNDCNNYEPIMTVSSPPSSFLKKV